MKIRNVLISLLLIATLLLSGCKSLDEIAYDIVADEDTTTNLVSTTSSELEESTTKVEFVDVTSTSTTSQKSTNKISIPTYSGKIYYKISEEPSFTKSEMVTKSFEKYSSLDSLGRCGVAYACLSKDTMPPKGDERGSISEIHPSGWVQRSYDFIDSGHLYDRCHMIAWMLSDEDANEKNLITGTRYFDTEGMLPFEIMVSDYIKETGNHVLYRITPDFRGNNLVCNGIQMEAKSVEDDGDGICFNVYIYNIQPNVTIDYATGNNWLTNSKTTTTTKKVTTQKSTTKKVTTTKATTTTTTKLQGETYILNTYRMKIHKPGCESVSEMNPKNRQEYTGNINDLLNQGYSKCHNCF